MILYKTDAEIELMKKSAVLVSQTLTEVANILKPGVTTFQLDKLCFEFIRDHKAIPSFLNYRGYPYTICASVNDVVVHGFPNNVALKEGDVVSIDMGVIFNGWHGDHAPALSLIEHRGAALSRDALLAEVWGYDEMPLTRTVDVHVAGLRQKIDSPRAPEYIVTVHGHGYKFVG